MNNMAYCTRLGQPGRQSSGSLSIVCRRNAAGSGPSIRLSKAYIVNQAWREICREIPPDLGIQISPGIPGDPDLQICRDPGHNVRECR
jgi:hypothetical protein